VTRAGSRQIGGKRLEEWCPKNVLYGQRIRSLLKELAMSELFRARWSEDIHRERITAVAEEASMDVTRLQRTRQFMDAAVPDALVIGYQTWSRRSGGGALRQHGSLPRRRGGGDRRRSRSRGAS
jgi:hypothetical protein